jgi:hypothetical protein
LNSDCHILHHLRKQARSWVPAAQPPLLLLGNSGAVEEEAEEEEEEASVDYGSVLREV